MATVGFTNLLNVTSWTTDQLKRIGRLRAQPWGEGEFEEGKRRRYDASHALRLVLVEGLMSQGVPMENASEVVAEHGRIIDRFFDALAAGQEPPPLFVSRLRVQEELAGVAAWMSWRMDTMGATPEAIGGAVRDILENMGKPNGRARVVGGPDLSVVSIAEAYRLLRQRARDAGFVVDGRSILSNGSLEEDDDE